MPLLLQAEEAERLLRRKRRKRLKPLKPPAEAERELQRRMARLWKEVLEPATERIVQAVRDGAGPAELADMVEQVLRAADFHYGMMADDVVWRWQMLVDKGTRLRLQRGLSESLGVDLTEVLDGPEVKEALAATGAEAALLIKTVPQDYLGEVARVVAANFRGDPLPEGRSLQRQIQHLGKVSERRARLIARDQTTKLTGTLNRVRQQAIGVEEYVWRTVKDNRVVGNPTGLYPKGNPKHMDHHRREGKKFRWDKPPADGHPGSAIQCRCWAEPVIDVKKVLARAQLT